MMIEPTQDADFNWDDALVGTYDVPPLEAGHVGVELDVPLDDPRHDTIQDWLDDNAAHYADQFAVRLDPVADSGPSDVPVIRLSGHHLRVRDALEEFFGDQQTASQAYTAVMNANPTGSIVGGVEARIGVYDERVTSFELHANTTESLPEEN